MKAAAVLSPEVGTARACAAMDIPRASYYRKQMPSGTKRTGDRKSHRALSTDEREQVLSKLHSDEFIDKAPHEVYATLLDSGVYHCSIRTMYRILRNANEVRERRDQLRHPQYKKPELLAEHPNQVWSWDITKLLGPVKWTYYCLYVIMDIFSRYVTGWMVADRENAALAQLLIEETCQKQDIAPEQLTIHADRGSPMKAKTTAQLFAELGIAGSHSRPHVSNDNPFSESHFKTLKYRPEFPKRFGSIEDARSFCRTFFSWYNQEHRHTGIGLLTPEAVHYGKADEVITHRNTVLSRAYHDHPERFVRKIPTAPLLPEAVWINPPKQPDGDGGFIP
jgi:putative transposase